MRRRFLFLGAALSAVLTGVTTAAAGTAYAGQAANAAGSSSAQLAPAAAERAVSQSPVDVLDAVSCTSGSFCMAVGARHITALGTSATLAEAWNGRTWRVLATPNRGTGTNALHGVSCRSATRCMAVGGTGLGRSTRTLAEAWNGRTWRLVRTPRSPVSEGPLRAVRCTRGFWCMATGTGHACELAEVWNGSRWRFLDTPNLADLAGLGGVSCWASSGCIAVGFGGEGFNAVAEIWNGRAWRLLTTFPAPHAFLGAVSCTKTRRCMAVGNTSTAGGERAQAQRWNTSTWQSVAVAGPARDLRGVSCWRTLRCIAVGQRTNESTLAEKWNGSTWQILTSPNP